MDDPHLDRQWALRRVGAPAAWETATGAGITIAIVDSGVDLRHPDLRDALVPGYDFVDDDRVPADADGHGTHVAGIAAARANNGIGIAGVAPRAKIMPVRVLDEDGEGSGSDVEAGVRWAVDNGADIINLSLADNVVIEGLTRGTMTEVVNYAWSKGAIPVVATGNGGLLRTDSDDANALIVTATNRDDEKPTYATRTGLAKWGIAAPGGSRTDDKSRLVLSTYWTALEGSGYGYGYGTSKAVPHVSGAAALLRSLGLDAQKTVDRLLATAKDLGDPGEDLTYGHGLVDAAAAAMGLRASRDSTIVPPRVDTTTPRPAEKPASADSPGVKAPVARTGGQEAPPPTSGASSPAPPPASAPDEKLIASGELSERSALINIVLGASLLGAAGALLGYGSFRRIRGRP